jgi:hypothetical protein
MAGPGEGIRGGGRKRRQKEARTVDSVNPGEEQNERDHNQKGEKSSRAILAIISTAMRPRAAGFPGI